MIAPGDAYFDNELRHCHSARISSVATINSLELRFDRKQSCDNSCKPDPCPLGAEKEWVTSWT
jgi:hypothetical protein